MLAGSVDCGAGAPVLRDELGEGIVRYWLHGSVSEDAARELSPAMLIGKLKAGLPMQELDELRRGLDLPMDKLGLPAVTVPATPPAAAGPVIEPAATTGVRDFVRSGRNLEGAR